MRLRAMSMLGLGLIAAGLEGQVRSHSEIDVLRRIAEERYAAGDLEQAAHTYLQIARSDSDPRLRAEGFLIAAWLQYSIGDERTARATLQEALVLDPHTPFDASLYTSEFSLLYDKARTAALAERRRQGLAIMEDAVAQMESGRDEQARLLFDRALELVPEHPPAIYNLALLSLRSRQIDLARSDFQRVVTLTEGRTGLDELELRSLALTRLGVIHREEDRFRDAEACLAEAVRITPRSAASWKQLGLTRFDSGDPQQAAVALQRARELSPTDRDVSINLSRSLAASGRLEQAVEVLDTDLRRHPEDAEMWLEMGQLAWRNGDSRAAEKALAIVLEEDSENAAGLAAIAATELARVHSSQGDSDQAMKFGQRAVVWEPDAADAWKVLGTTQLAAGDHAAAAASLLRAVELAPADSDSLVALGEAYVDGHDLQQAEACYLRALALVPDSEEAKSGLQQVRAMMAAERAIVAGRAKPRKPIPPKKIGLEFVDLNYDGLSLRGALVKEVSKKSPAARAGMRKGDLVLWIGDYEVTSDKDFFRYLKRNPPSDILEVEYLRDGRIYPAAMTLR